jgi:hypothetical protein
MTVAIACFSLPLPMALTALTRFGRDVKSAPFAIGEKMVAVYVFTLFETARKWQQAGAVPNTSTT